MRVGVAVGEDRADLHAADSRLQIEFHGERLGDKLFLRQVGEHFFRIDEDGVSAGRPLVGYAVVVQQVAQQLHLADAGVELFVFGIFVQPHGQRIHVAARHAAVGHVALEHDAEGHGLPVELFAAHGHEPAHVHHTVLLGRDGHDVGIGVDFADDLLDGLVGIAFLAGLDEIGILGETGRVEQQGYAIAAADFGRFADVAHRHGLAAGRVVGDGQHDARDFLARVLAQELFELGDVHLTLERQLFLGVGRIVDRAVHGVAAAEFDVPFGGVEMGVARDDVARLEQCRKDHVLRSTPLVRGQEIGHPEDAFDRLLEPEIGRGPGIAFVAGHHGRPLAVAHRTCARVGQQVDRDLVAAQLEKVVAGFADPCFALRTGGGADGLGHLDLVRFCIRKCHRKERFRL